MFKRIVFGLVWFLVFWIGGSALGGGIAGGIAASKLGNKANAASGAAVGSRAGAEFDKKYGLYLLFGAAMVAAFGTVAGILPGTRETSAEASLPEHDPK